LNSTDKIAKFNLTGNLKYPVTPGSSVVGEIVQVGGGVSKFKVGHRIFGVCAHGTLAEYAIVNADYLIELRGKNLATQETFVEVFEGSRVEAELRRFEHEEKELSRDEHRRRVNANERLGYIGGGVTIVLGEGAHARVAIQVIKATSTSKDHRILLIVPDNGSRWGSSFYDIQDSDLLVSSNDVPATLKSIGGIRLAIAVDQPENGFDHLLDAMRYGGEIVVLSAHHERQLRLPLGQIVSKALVVRGAVWPDRHSLEKCLELVDRHALHVSVNRYHFTNEGVNAAFADLQHKTKFDQPVIVVSELPQPKED
jgi:D-arabinose 1-dehydrogenase-like Zn-dependent alcohol dehydrogenase